MSLSAFAAAVLLAMGAPVVQEPPPSEDPQVLEQEADDLGEIEVVGRRARMVRTFIQQATAAPPGRRLARWDRTICVGVANLEQRYAEFMIDRIALVAAEVGLQSGEPGCKPNIIISAAADAEALARGLVADDPQAFRPASGVSDLGADALEQFQATDAPVRWWHVSLPVGADFGELAVSLDGEAIVGQSGSEPRTIAVRDPSRLRANTREDLVRAYVIIDVTKVGRVGFGALSDYVALVSLAQMAPESDTSRYDTVLNLFQEGSDRTAGLTQWDRDYLKSLYGARRDRLRSTQQAQDIIRSMTAREDDAEDEELEP